MKVNFIIPSWKYWKEPLRAQPLTQMYLATILENEGVDIEFTDFRDGEKEVNKADIYFYTVASPDYKETIDIVQRLRKEYPNSNHVAGGPHITIFPKTKGFDSVVIGRGEESIKQIIIDFPNLQSNYSMGANKDYPFPKRHFLPKEKIVNETLFKTDNMKSTTVQFSFGCPFNCSFCANYSRGPIRRNSLKQISDEIDYLKSEYGIEGLSLQDEIAIPLNPKEAKEFLELMKSKDIQWRGQVRAFNNIELLKLAKESGLIELSFGLESVNQKVLDLTGKQMNTKVVEEMIKECKELDIKIRLYLLNGLPGETESIVQETKDFIERTNPELVLLSSLQPYPGSPIADNPGKYGIKWVSKEYDQFNHLLCRFEDSNDNPEDAVPFEYEKGKGLSRKQIINNMLKLQEYLRGRDMNK